MEGVRRPRSSGKGTPSPEKSRNQGRNFRSFSGPRFGLGKEASGILPEPLFGTWDTTPTRMVVKIQHWSGSTCGAVEFSIRAGDPVRFQCGNEEKSGQC